MAATLTHWWSTNRLSQFHSGLVIIFNIWQKWPNWQKCIIFNIWQQFQQKMAKWPNMLSKFHLDQLIIFWDLSDVLLGLVLSLLVQMALNCDKSVQLATGSSYKTTKRAFVVLRRAKIVGKKWLEWPNLVWGRPDCPKWPTIGQVNQNGLGGPITQRYSFKSLVRYVKRNFLPIVLGVCQQCQRQCRCPCRCHDGGEGKEGGDSEELGEWDL